MDRGEPTRASGDVREALERGPDGRAQYALDLELRRRIVDPEPSDLCLGRRRGGRHCALDLDEPHACLLPLAEHHQ